MDEIQHERMCENAALGEAMMMVLAEIYCCETKEAPIKRGVYKFTDCGAWIAFTPTGVTVGSIVEGSDDDCTPIEVPYDGDDDKFRKAFFAALEAIEEEADEMWQEANGEE